MARIEGEMVIGHPVDVVSDYVADQSNEPQFNLRIVRPGDHRGACGDRDPVPPGGGVHGAHG